MSFIPKSSEKQTSLKDPIVEKKRINAPLSEENASMQNKLLAAGYSKRYNCLAD